jgi:hypothetical protein
LNNIDKIEEVLPRALIWFNISQLNKQGVLRLEDYITFVQNKLLDEPQTLIVNQLLSELHGFMHGYLAEDIIQIQAAKILDAVY